MIKIALGSDHAGYETKEILKDFLKNNNCEVTDVGTTSTEKADYPDYAKKVVENVLKSKVDYGLLICGSGIGMSIVANRYKGIRAALVTDKEHAALARAHNNANIMCVGARFASPENIQSWLEVFLSTGFQGGRHAERAEKYDKE